jgi:CRP-like cAMP-binding protein
LREKLISAVEFQYFEKNRLLLLQGHAALSMYFIVNGEVLISKSEYDPDQKKNVNKPLKLLQSGDFFGHVGMIYEFPRNATVTSQSRLTMNALVY